MVSDKFIRKLFRNPTALAYKIFLILGTNPNMEFMYQKDLARHFKKSISTINYHITKFKEEGLIKFGLELSDAGKHNFDILWKNVETSKLRAHNIQALFKLTKCPKDFVRRYSRSIFKIIDNGRYRGLKGRLNGITFMFYSTKKIVCVIKDIYANDDEEISSMMQLFALEFKETLENEFEGIKIGGFEFARIQTSHIAIRDSITAKKIGSKGFTYNGKILSADKSHGNYEIELTNPSNNLTNIMDLVKLEKRLL